MELYRGLARQNPDAFQPNLAGLLSNLANRLSGGAVANTVASCRLIAGVEAEVWVAERPVPILFGYADAEQAYEAL